MNQDVERQLMRLLYGELSAEEAVRWRRRIDETPELAIEYAALEAAWSGLEAPETVASIGFEAAFWRRQQQVEDDSLAAMWRLAPGWSRALAAATLAVGIGVGVLAGSGAADSADGAIFGEYDPTLAESYWVVIADAEVDNGSEVTP